MRELLSDHELALSEDLLRVRSKLVQNFVILVSRGKKRGRSADLVTHCLQSWFLFTLIANTVSIQVVRLHSTFQCLTRVAHFVIIQRAFAVSRTVTVKLRNPVALWPSNLSLMIKRFFV